MILDKREEFEVDDEKSRLDLNVIHAFLNESYWAVGIPMEVVVQSIAGSDCFGVYREDAQIGFARVVTDNATFAYLCDVFVLPDYRDQGLGKWLVETVMQYSNYQSFRRWLLATRDAHELYRPFGFTDLETPAKFMEIKRKDVYMSEG
ncbi:MAG: GNAT family N-acetyltransferase [Rhodospirillaceae bacterium]